jgi:mono/diheme cytochrome c family protein
VKVLVSALALALAAPAAHAADAARGAQIYVQHCASCHGANGVSVMPMAPNFARSERMLQPDFQLLMAIKAGKGPMPAYNGILGDRDIYDVIAYLRTLRR